MTYGYDADVANWIAPAGQNTVREHAQNLINDVHRYRVRTSTTRKSILWVVHSLGGLVLQDALVVCNNPRDEGQREVLLCTKGIAFMGTPHAGSDFAKFAVAVSNIINLSMVKKTNNSILSVLQSHSEMLANIRDDFMTIVNARAAKAQPIQLHSFIEELVVASTGHVSISIFSL
jgi:triacylglycerol esterase/lipase EstA (alpha/beta hydrolase family)